MLKKDMTIKISEPKSYWVVPGFGLLKESLFDTLKSQAEKDGLKISIIKEPVEPVKKKAKKKESDTKVIPLQKQRLTLNKELCQEYGYDLDTYMENFLFQNLTFFIEKEFPDTMGLKWNEHIKTLNRHNLYRHISLFGVRKLLSKIIRIPLTTTSEFNNYEMAYYKEYSEIDKAYQWIKTKDRLRNLQERETDKVYKALNKIEDHRCPPFVKEKLKEMFAKESHKHLSFYHWFFNDYHNITQKVLKCLDKQKWYKNLCKKRKQYYASVNKVERRNDRTDTKMMQRIIKYRNILWT